MTGTLSHYKILDRLGAGGLGDVYRARDTKLGRTVAIKILPPDLAGDVDRRERLMREARAAAALSHPNIAALFEIGEDGDRLFLVFEYVVGETLRAMMAGQPLNPKRAIDLATEIADALGAAHAQGIVHCDIRPENIFVTAKGHAKVLDVGLATFTGGGEARNLAATQLETGQGVVQRTAAYLSPEQVLGERGDHRTDIFSLGIVLFEMLTGQAPFSGASGDATAIQIVQATPPPPSRVNRHVPVEADAIVMRALAKSLDGRYASATAMAMELRGVAAALEIRSAAEDPFMPLSARRRFGLPLRALGIALAIALMGVAGWCWRQN